MKKNLFFRTIAIVALFFSFVSFSVFLQSCDSLFHEEGLKPLHVNKGEVGDKDTYLTHFPDGICQWYGMKKTLYIKQGDREPTVCFVYNKDKFGGVCRYTCEFDKTSMTTLVDETQDRNKHWGALMILVRGVINTTGEIKHNVKFTLYDKDKNVIVEREYVYFVVSTPKN